MSASPAPLDELHLLFTHTPDWQGALLPEPPHAAPSGSAGLQVCDVESQYEVVMHAVDDIAHDDPSARRGVHVLPLVPLKLQ